MDITLRNPELDNEDGACWTCLSHKRKCDRMLPRCRACCERHVKCSGYGVRISWPKDISASKQQSQHRQRASGPLPADAVRLDRHVLPSSISALTLPTTESFYMQHFLQREFCAGNIARIALAIDHDGNGYRSLLPMALTEPCVLNAALAVAASHHSRWQRIPDNMSRKYLRTACKAVRDRFTDPRLIQSPATLAAMLLLVSYEVFSGSSRWKGHHTAIRGWIQGRRDCSDIDSFLKNWVCLIDTQNALNLGTSTIPELEEWMGAASSDRGYTVDALFGCSARLPRLMAAASRLYVASKQAEISEDWVQDQAESLQTRIRSTRLQDNSQIMVGLSCNNTPQEFSVTVGVDKEELQRRAGATAKIFRHAAHIYVHRIAHEPMEALTPDTQESLETALQLLTQVPDALGPGANLGWCLVVLGAELDLAEQREYINSRWDGLHLLGIDNTKNGQKILDEVWNHRDLVRRGFAVPERWQDIMQRIGQSQILV